MKDTVGIENSGYVAVDTEVDRVLMECDADGWSIAYMKPDEARRVAAALLAAADRAEGQS